MRRISASITSFYQFVFAPTFIVGLGLVIAVEIAVPGLINVSPLAPFIIAWVVVSAICLPIFGWVNVYVSGDKVTISRFWKKDVVLSANTATEV